MDVPRHVACQQVFGVPAKKMLPMRSYKVRPGFAQMGRDDHGAEEQDDHNPWGELKKRGSV